MASPSQKRYRIKKGILLSAVLIVVVLLIAFLIHSYKPPQETVAPSETDKLFKLNLRQYANTITIDNGKFFIMDDHGNLTCVDAQNGDLLWQAHVGNWRSGGLLTNNGTLYAGIGHGAIQAVDEVTGRLLTCYQGLVSTAWKGPPEVYSIADGRIFISQDGINAYNIATGKMLWKSNPITMLNPEGMPYTRSIWAFEGKLVLAAGGYQKDDSWFNGIYRIDPDQGTPQWSIKGYTYNTPLVFENKVILSNYGSHWSVNLCDSVIAVTVSSGIKLWSYDFGAPHKTNTVRRSCLPSFLILCLCKL